MTAPPVQKGLLIRLNAERFHACRNAVGLSIAEVASRAGVSPVTIHRNLNGTVAHCRPAFIRAMMAVFPGIPTLFENYDPDAERKSA